MNPKNKLQLILDDLLTQGIIKESSSPYCSHVVLVRKMEKELVYVLTLGTEQINSARPLPDTTDRRPVGFAERKKKHFTCLDLKNGFHHVKMDPESVKYTSFVTPLGQYMCICHLG